ncbi:MAG TPA: formate/nitrite transporter family protein, partial [Paracoccaceae bacterium]|nr:formate/nitrite transporter family protein [Paracoccaceae bacterium]
MTAGADAYGPAEIAARVESAGVAKARMPLRQMLALAVLAGAFIGFGTAFFLVAMTGADPGFGPQRVLGGVVFSLGLILVVVGGAELFTGNALMVMAWVDGRIRAGEVVRAWAIVWLGNLVGAAGLALAFGVAGLAGGGIGATVVGIAEAKAALTVPEALVRGALCNALVCLAVWLSIGARTAEGRILAIVWPVAAFVALGLEHSVANMFLFPLAALAGAQVTAAEAAANLFWVGVG